MTTAAQVGRLEEIARLLDHYQHRFERARDERAVFTFLYAGTTHALAREVGRIVWDDEEWVVCLAEAFARRYVNALDAFDGHRDVPQAWQDVFTTICGHGSSVLEDLVYPMAAHIIHDLPLALLDTGMNDPVGRPRLPDFHRMNDVLGTAVNGLQAAVTRRYNPVLGWLDRLGGSRDELLTNYGLRIARGMAWYNGMRLSDDGTREAARASISSSPGALIREVRDPPLGSVRTILRIVRVLTRLLRRWPS